MGIGAAADQAAEAAVHAGAGRAGEAGIIKNILIEAPTPCFTVKISRPNRLKPNFMVKSGRSSPIFIYKSPSWNIRLS
jgi:hypothetical protein